MTAIQFIDLVKRMRAAQKFYYKLHPVNDREKKLEALIKSKQLEKEVDTADIDDPANLEIDFPRAEGSPV